MGGDSCKCFVGSIFFGITQALIYMLTGKRVILMEQAEA
jgi:hypothetical protein